MRKDVQDIFLLTPRQKQVMMFSATLSEDVRVVCKKFMRDVRGSGTPAGQAAREAGQGAHTSTRQHAPHTITAFIPHLHCLTLSVAGLSFEMIRRPATAAAVGHCDLTAVAR